MEKIEKIDGNEYRYDDDINKVAINLVVKAIRSRYPYIIGYRINTITTVIFIELKVDCGMLGKDRPGEKIFFLDNFYGDVGKDDDNNIKKLVKQLYDGLPDEVVDHYYSKYKWSDKEYESRMSLHLMNYYCK